MSPSLASPAVPAWAATTPASIDDEYTVTAQRYHRRFCSVAYRILRDPDEAEDVVQEAHMRALAHLDQFQGRAALSTWVMQIVTNEALIRLRRRVPSVELDSLTLRSESSDPEEEVAGRQLRALILAGIRTLPEPYRTAFYIRVICEKSAAETAAYLGVTIGCVKTRLHRAKSLLRKKLRAPLGMASAAGGRRRVRIPASLDLGRRS